MDHEILLETRKIHCLGFEVVVIESNYAKAGEIKFSVPHVIKWDSVQMILPFFSSPQIGIKYIELSYTKTTVIYITGLLILNN